LRASCLESAQVVGCGIPASIDTDNVSNPAQIFAITQFNLKIEADALANDRTRWTPPIF
jgi:hypothetical protein